MLLALVLQNPDWDALVDRLGSSDGLVSSGGSSTPPADTTLLGPDNPSTEPCVKIGFVFEGESG